MNPLLKLHLGSAAYCAILVSLNWFRIIEYTRKSGLTKESLTPVGLAALLSGAAALYLILLCLRAARTRLEEGRKIAPGRWIQSRAVLLYALPLLWHQESTSSWMEPDGSMATLSRGYGHGLSTQVFFFAIAGMLLFQILARLTSDDKDDATASAFDYAPHPSA